MNRGTSTSLEGSPINSYEISAINGYRINEGEGTRHLS